MSRKFLTYFKIDSISSNFNPSLRTSPTPQPQEGKCKPHKVNGNCWRNNLFGMFLCKNPHIDNRAATPKMLELRLCFSRRIGKSGILLNPNVSSSSD